MDQPATRRTLLRLLVGAPLLALAESARAADGALIERLIKQAGAHARVADRIEFVSRALLGVRYEAHTLIGGPRRPEQFVVREDAFDCVTYCEFVLAAALSHDRGEFESWLRRIRYENGNVRWDQRNHYFADWCRRNIENRICHPVAVNGSTTIDKTVDLVRGLGRRRVSFAAVPRAALLANKSSLAKGDVIGFASNRPNMDFFHTGLVTFRPDGTLMLRHASQSRGRVLEERMETFVAVNPVRYVTLLRVADNAPVVGGT
jgi:hypothetical protein